MRAQKIKPVSFSDWFLSVIERYRLETSYREYTLFCPHAHVEAVKGMLLIKGYYHFTLTEQSIPFGYVNITVQLDRKLSFKEWLTRFFR